MKKICFLVDSVFTVGGVQRVTAVIAKSLSDSADVTIATFDSPTLRREDMWGLDESAVRTVHVAYPRVGGVLLMLCKCYSALYKLLRLPWEWASRLYARSSFPAPMRQHIADELCRGGYDVVVGVHAPLAARLATLRPRLKGVMLVGWIHNSFEALYGSQSTYIGPALKRHYISQLRQLNAVVVLSHHDASQYASYDSRLRPAVIYNPLTLVPGETSRGTSHRFLAVGRLSALHKGFDILIEAFSIFAKHDDLWHLDIVGEGEEAVVLQALISKLKMEQRITIHPFTADIQRYYSEAQVYVLSSRWEGFGLVLIEAMAHGLPVVTSDLPTSKELLGDDALYFENGNAAQLAQRLSEATQIDWQLCSRKAKARAKQFGIDSIRHQWTELLSGKDLK